MKKLAPPEKIHHLQEVSRRGGPTSHLMSAPLCTDKELDISVSVSSRQWRQIILISPKTFYSNDSSFPLKTDTETDSEFTGTISRLQLSEGVTELQDAVSRTRKEEPGHWPAPLWLTSHMEAPGSLRELKQHWEDASLHWRGGCTAACQAPGLSSIYERSSEDATSEHPHGK